MIHQRSSNNVSVEVNGTSISIQRPKLKVWFYLDSLVDRIMKAVERNDYCEVADLIIEYLSTASNSDIWKDVFWVNAIQAFQDILGLCKLRIDFPMFSKWSHRSKDDPWDYDGRLWYDWVNLIAKNYGWTIEYIESLEVEDAFGLVQEILIDDQFEKEWEWGLSDKSVTYNAKDKTSRFRPLPRPPWMMPKSELTITKLLKSSIPIGNVVDLSGITNKTSLPS